MDQQIDRQRTVTWSDPMIAAQIAQKLSGLDFLQGIVSGQIPPPPT